MDNREKREVFRNSLILDSYLLKRESRHAYRTGILSKSQFKEIIKTLAAVKRATRLIS